MAEEKDQICVRCGLPLPPGWRGDHCPRCGANLTGQASPAPGFSAIIPAFCGLMAGIVVGWNMLRLAFPQGLQPREVMLGALAVGLISAFLIVWLFRRLLPATGPILFQVSLALLVGALVVLLLGGLAAERAAATATFSVWADPGLLLAGQVGLTLMVYLLIRRVQL